MNAHHTGVELGYDKQSGTNKNVGPVKLGYEEDNAPKVQTVKALPTQKEVKVGYEDQNVSNVSSKNIAPLVNTNGIGYA